MYLFSEKPTERKESVTNSSDSQLKSGEDSKPLLETNKTVPQNNGAEERRGRYWNYEHNRWSFCEGKHKRDFRNDSYFVKKLNTTKFNSILKFIIQSVAIYSNLNIYSLFNLSVWGGDACVCARVN